MLKSVSIFSYDMYRYVKPIFQVVKNNLNPHWRPFQLPVHSLCGGDKKKPIKVSTKPVGLVTLQWNVTLKSSADYHLGLVVRNLSSLLGNNKGTDQPVHLHSLISAFVIHFL